LKHGSGCKAVKPSQQSQQQHNYLPHHPSLSPLLLPHCTALIAIHRTDPTSPFPSPLQVVYINTSLKTKALAHHEVPTITCTSSNVVQTVLTAFAQVGRGRGWAGVKCTVLVCSPDVAANLHPAANQRPPLWARAVPTFLTCISPFLPAGP